MKVFISHSSVDKKFVQRLATDLRTREGIDAWFDQWEINLGDRIPERLEEGLSEAEVLTLVLSPDSVNSQWVEYERQAWLAMQIEEEKHAEEESRPPARRLIPVLYRDCQKPAFLQPIHHVKITDQECEGGFKQLVNAIMGASEKPPLDKSKDYQALYKRLKSLGEGGKEDARRLLKESNDPDVLRTCLDLLGEDAKDYAMQLLKESENHQVLCTCINLLGDEAKDDAKGFLTESNDPKVHCACLDLLGDAAKPFAVERIPCWTETDPALLVRCFQVAGATPEAGKAAAEMLAAWNKRVPSILRASALRAPFDTPLRIQRAYEVIHNWRGEYRPLVGAALAAFEDPNAVVEYCIEILRRWHQEIFYRHKNNKMAYDGHIIKALSHPALKDDAYDIAQKLLNVEAGSPGFLSPELRRQAENIIRGEGPIWRSSEA